MKGRVHLSAWKNVQAEQHFRALEDVFWHELWPDPPEPFDIETHTGPTRAYRWAGEGEPVVFLHGVGGTSIMWSDYIGRLAGRTAYAIDTIGDVGRSRQQIPVTDANDLAQWLDEVLEGLGIDHAHLAGSSYGGFLALNQASRMPTRVRSITLLDPVSLVPLKLGPFLRWGCSVMLASYLPQRTRNVAARKLRFPALQDKRMMRIVTYGQLNYRTRLLRPEPLTDTQLQSLAVPVLLLLGEKSEIHDSRVVQARAIARIPAVDTELVAGAGHALPMSHTEHCAARMVDFLGLQRVEQ